MLGLEADKNISEDSFVKERQRDAELGDSVMVRNKIQRFCLLLVAATSTLHRRSGQPTKAKISP